jgi:hypothetical protein
MHSIVVTIICFTLVPLYSYTSSLPTRTLTDPSILSITPISSILYTFSSRITASGKLNAFEDGDSVETVRTVYLVVTRPKTLVLVLVNTIKVRDFSDLALTTV